MIQTQESCPVCQKAGDCDDHNHLTFTSNTKTYQEYLASSISHTLAIISKYGASNKAMAPNSPKKPLDKQFRAIAFGRRA